MAEKFLIIFNPSVGGAFNVTLPHGPADGEAHRLKYVGPFAAQYPITVLPDTTTNPPQTIDLGLVASVPLSGSSACVEFVWSAALNTWSASWM